MEKVPLAWVAAGLAALGFVTSIIVQLRAFRRRDAARIRAAIHERHLQRIGGKAHELPSHGAGLLPPDHPYASDLDLIGPGSLFQRLDVSHTRRGERVLAEWLGAPAARETIAARQGAVRELAPQVELRQELEASARLAGEEKLDHRPFLAFVKHPPFFPRARWAGIASMVLPPITVALVIAW